MKTSICSIAGIKLTAEDYDEIAYNIGRMKDLSLQRRLKIVEQANNMLSEETRREIQLLVINLANEKRVYEIAGLSYSDGPPADQLLFTSGVTEYVLKKMVT